MNDIEALAIPGAGAIIRSVQNGKRCILVQERYKKDGLEKSGLLEIPAGKIRAFESIFDVLRREVKEETGLEVTHIEGEETASIYSGNDLGECQRRGRMGRLLERDW